MRIEEYNLPTSEQLEQFYYLRGLLQNNPKNASAEEKKAFCDLVLGVCPDAMDIRDIDLVQKLCPEEWRKYCNWEWGTPEELRATKEEMLIQQGWEQGADGEMYIPFP
jgi:hypothetical protein